MLPYISQVWIGRFSADSTRATNIHESICCYSTTAALVSIFERAVQKLLLTEADLLAGVLVKLTFKSSSSTESP